MRQIMSAVTSGDKPMKPTLFSAMAAALFALSAIPSDAEARDRRGGRDNDRHGYHRDHGRHHGHHKPSYYRYGVYYDHYAPPRRIVYGNPYRGYYRPYARKPYYGQPYYTGTSFNFSFR
jgi:hypothetical protein